MIHKRRDERWSCQMKKKQRQPSVVSTHNPIDSQANSDVRFNTDIMTGDISTAIAQTKEMMDQAIEHLYKELNQLRTGKATPAMLTGVMVDYYGATTPLAQIANIVTLDSRSLSIQPWDKSAVPAIEKAIMQSNLGLTPQNDGEAIHLNIPVLTEERRIDIVKQAKHFGEEAKVSARNARHEALTFIRAEVKDGYPEDDGKRLEKKLDELTKEYGKKIDDIVSAKEKEILTV